jgi:7,8-dihydropterin-6-yl-methyl-4-(beta-D-ribofuranosyl)aminobenzene 5'-phosphate synthase
LPTSWKRGKKVTVKITCLVDNAAQQASPFWGEHGFSALIETEEGRLLFDTGQSGTVLLHNLRVVGLSPLQVNMLALSHAHYDHTGGLPMFLQNWWAVAPSHSEKPALYANADLFRERFTRRDEGLKNIGLGLSRETLSRYVDLRLSDEPQQILPGIYTTGRIQGRAEPEGRSPRHLVREGEQWTADPYHDDMSLVLQVEQGWVLVCGCCHAGLLNTLHHVRAAFPGEIRAILGGTHLECMEDGQMQRIAQVLREYGSPRLYLNHCTGQRGYVTLATTFGDRVFPCPSGTVLTL